MHCLHATTAQHKNTRLISPLPRVVVGLILKKKYTRKECGWARARTHAFYMGCIRRHICKSASTLRFCVFHNRSDSLYLMNFILYQPIDVFIEAFYSLLFFVSPARSIHCLCEPLICFCKREHFTLMNIPIENCSAI